jgi:hypothetical protein
MKKKIFIIIKNILIICIFIFIIMLFLIKILDLFMNKYSNKVYSQDGNYYAQTDETNGGATTGFISGVTITNANSFLSYFRILSAWSGNSKNIFGSNGNLDSIKLEWLDNNTLKVTYSDCHKVYGQDKTWKDIKIVYDGKCSPK